MWYVYVLLAHVRMYSVRTYTRARNSKHSRSVSARVRVGGAYSRARVAGAYSRVRVVLAHAGSQLLSRATRSQAWCLCLLPEACYRGFQVASYKTWNGNGETETKRQNETKQEVTPKILILTTCCTARIGRLCSYVVP